MKNSVVTSYKYSFKIVYKLTTTNPLCNDGDDKISDIYIYLMREAISLVSMYNALYSPFWPQKHPKTV